MEKPEYIDLISGRAITASDPAYGPTYIRILGKLNELGVKRIEDLPDVVREGFEDELEQIADIILDYGGKDPI